MTLRPILPAARDGGRVVPTQAFGVRNVAGVPLATTTVMYGASLTKAVFADLVLQLADEGRLDLDTVSAQAPAVVMRANDLRAEAAFPALVRAVLGETVAAGLAARAGAPR